MSFPCPHGSPLNVPGICGGVSDIPWTNSQVQCIFLSAFLLEGFLHAWKLVQPQARATQNGHRVSAALDTLHKRSCTGVQGQCSRCSSVLRGILHGFSEGPQQDGTSFSTLITCSLLHHLFPCWLFLPLELPDKIQVIQVNVNFR